MSMLSEAQACQSATVETSLLEADLASETLGL